ncbi:MAG TPA: hypothetical protein ENK59_01625 [Thioploca sp.]|nr:hypothetical protein [Thioploca sp.]
MNCYCKKSGKNEYCGVCEICGEPGHTHAHPRLPTTGAWCEKHWQELNDYKILTLADIIISLLFLFIIGITVFNIVIS